MFHFQSPDIDKQSTEMMTIVKDENAKEITLPETSSGAKCKRESRLTSRVWQHFKRLEKMPGQRGECICNHCKRVFASSGTSGTTHLNRHIFLRRCPVLKKEIGPSLAIPISYSMGYMEKNNSLIAMPHKFNQGHSTQDLAEIIISWGLPFDFVEDASFKKFVSSISPNYSFVSKDLVRKSCVQRYEMEKYKLKEVLQGSISRVCLTTETWTSSQDLRYVALRVHFVDSNWILHKKILKFFTIPSSLSGHDLAGVAVNCLEEWNIKKISTITLEHTDTNDLFARTLSKHCLSRGLPIQGRTFQVHCWGHVLNLIVHEGLNEFVDSIRRVRNAVKYVKLCNERKLELLHYADQEHISRGKMLVIDRSTQWDSTYKMLDSALHYKRAYDHMRSNNPHFKDPPTPEDWEKTKIVHHFLESFIIVSKAFSSTDKSSTNVFFREIYRIVKLLREAATDLSSLLGRMALSILDKFEKYWVVEEPNILFSVAAVLDPRFKLKYLKFCYNKIYDPSLVGDLVCHVEEVLRKLFDEYVIEFEADSLVNDTSTNSTVLSSSSLGQTTNFMEEFYKFTEAEDALPPKSELDVYLEEKLHRNILSDEENDFNILEWWKASSSRFKVLSKMARDILAIPVSSISLDRACGNTGKVLNSFHSSLLPSTVEALVCAQDWIRDEPIHREFVEEMDLAFSAPNAFQSVHGTY